MDYALFFIATFILAFVLTLVVRGLALRYKVLDYPDKERKLHARAIPLLGGIAIFVALALSLVLGNRYILSGQLEIHHWIGVLIGGLILMIGGCIDDVKKLTPRQQIIFPLLASITVVLGGVGIEKITDPTGGLLYFGQWTASLFTILWLMGMTYTTKLLDGVDGLVSSLTAVGSIVIFLFTITTRWYQPDIAFAALMLAAACLGFLIMNWHPARIFLGEGGSLFLGFMLGVLSIISGGKIAIALLIMGIPILDVVWTIIRRLGKGKNPFRFADRQHLHFRLQDAGLGPKTTVLLFCLSSAIFGLSGLFLQSRGKIMTLAGLCFLMILIIAVFGWLDRRPKVR